MVGGGLLSKEEVLEVAVEELGCAAGRLHEQHPVALGHRDAGS